MSMTQATRVNELLRLAERVSREEASEALRLSVLVALRADMRSSPLVSAPDAHLLLPSWALPLNVQFLDGYWEATVFARHEDGVSFVCTAQGRDEARAVTAAVLHAEAWAATQERIWMPYLNNARNGVWVLRNAPRRDDQLYTHVFGDGRPAVHLHVATLRLASASVPVVPVQVEQEIVDYLLLQRRVSARRMEELDARPSDEPVLLVELPGPEHLLVDGAHRYVHAYQQAKSHVFGRFVPAEVAIRALVTLPDELSLLLASDVLLGFADAPESRADGENMR